MLPTFCFRLCPLQPTGEPRTGCPAAHRATPESSYATPPALVAVATLTMFRVVSYAGLDGRRHVHAEPLIPAARNSSWQPGGNRLHSDDPAFAEFTGGTDPIPLYDVQAA